MPEISSEMFGRVDCPKDCCVACAEDGAYCVFLLFLGATEPSKVCAELNLVGRPSIWACCWAVAVTCWPVVLAKRVFLAVRSIVGGLSSPTSDLSFSSLTRACIEARVRRASPLAFRLPSEPESFILRGGGEGSLLWFCNPEARRSWASRLIEVGEASSIFFDVCLCLSGGVYITWY